MRGNKHASVMTTDKRYGNKAKEYKDIKRYEK